MPSDSSSPQQGVCAYFVCPTASARRNPDSKKNPGISTCGRSKLDHLQHPEQGHIPYCLLQSKRAASPQVIFRFLEISRKESHLGSVGPRSGFAQNVVFLTLCNNRTTPPTELVSMYVKSSLRVNRSFPYEMCASNLKSKYGGRHIPPKSTSFCNA